VEQQQESHSLRDHLVILRRRAWMIAFVAIITTASAIAFSLSQSKLYQATATVLVNNQSLAATQAGFMQTPNTQTADRDLQTQALNAQTTAVYKQATRGTTGMSAETLQSESSVTPDVNADQLSFSVRDGHPGRAMKFANKFAAAYVTVRTRQDTAKVDPSIRSAECRLGLPTSPPCPQQANTPPLQPRSPEAQQLEAQLTSLQELRTLLLGNARVANVATDASLIRPTSVKTGVIGAILGLFLGIGFAFLSDALDTRVRSADDLAELLGLPLLARISAPPRNLQRSNELAMMSMAPGTHAESYRKLRTSFDFANLRHQAQTIVITSALPQEGKSTTIANLAVAMARSGRDVALVDLDLRRPIIASFFDLEGRPGITDAALGTAALEDVMVATPLTRDAPDDTPPMRETGNLYVVPAGTVPPDPAEFCGSPALGDILAALKDRVDLVLIDAPPVLAVSDAMTLSATVDALMVVTRANVVRRPMITELRRQLAAAPCVKLGFILTNAEADAEYGYESQYGFGGAYASPPKQSVATERTT